MLTFVQHKCFGCVIYVPQTFLCWSSEREEKSWLIKGKLLRFAIATSIDRGNWKFGKGEVEILILIASWTLHPRAAIYWETLRIAISRFVFINAVTSGIVNYVTIKSNLDSAISVSNHESLNVSFWFGFPYLSVDRLCVLIE